VTVLTLERIVALRDFEDFARSFAGIGKAQAVPLWKGETRLVHVTIAAEAAAVEPGASPTPLASHVVDSQSDLFQNLVAAIGAARDPSQHFVVESYQPLFFNLKARVKVDPRLETATVFTGVEDALKAAFAFEQRAFGQPATAARFSPSCRTPRAWLPRTSSSCTGWMTPPPHPRTRRPTCCPPIPSRRSGTRRSFS
jgi:hypothetical protein